MIEHASPADLDRIEHIENEIFSADRLSRRSLKYLLTKGNATTLVDRLVDAVRGYAIILYNVGTSLARLYSLGVGLDFRGLGVGVALLRAAEQDALDNDCVAMRLEVRRDNTAAIQLYQKNGYKQFDVVPDYYEDHTEALRFEKKLVSHPNLEMVRVPYYQQTCDFTCGPAALMMAMKSLEPNLAIDRKLELRIWRESTTIFMTSGHGGCSPFGLALAAYDRGYDVRIFVKNNDILFLDSVRHPGKKEVIQLVQEDQLAEIKKRPIRLEYGVLSVGQIQTFFQKGNIPIVLISSYRIYREKFPHWVVVTGFDDRFIYVHDSYVDADDEKTETDCINMPILKKDFERMSQYGKSGQKAVLILNKRKI
jgi:ribosomal protein S18 acetylase RimI-like enzyme